MGFAWGWSPASHGSRHRTAQVRREVTTNKSAGDNNVRNRSRPANHIRLLGILLACHEGGEDTLELESPAQHPFRGVIAGGSVSAGRETNRERRCTVRRSTRTALASMDLRRCGSPASATETATATREQSPSQISRTFFHPSCVAQRQTPPDDTQTAPCRDANSVGQVLLRLSSLGFVVK